MKKSQTAIEFIILVGFVLFFFTIFFVLIQGNMAEKLKERKNLQVKEIALIIKDEINLAYNSADGYTRNFNIPGNIDGLDYDAIILDEMIYVKKTSGGKIAIALPIKPVSGQIIKGNNLIKKENNKIKINI